jgi:hypothetical protein
MAPPVDSRELDSWYKELNHYLELGIVYTMIAGLLNVLAIYDAWGGPVQLDEESPSKPTGQPAKSGG